MCFKSDTVHPGAAFAYFVSAKSVATFVFLPGALAPFNSFPVPSARQKRKRDIK